MNDWDFDDDDETTAVVNLADLRRQAPVEQQDHHVLVHVQGTELGRVRELRTDRLLLGRSPEADVWLGDDGVSRKHAQLVREGHNYFVEDLGSANGTFVQGERVVRRQLEDGDQIQLGPAAVFRYSVTDDDQMALLQQLYSTSVTDALTGARNREFLDALLVTELSYAKRHDRDLSFVLFDLDHFKRVNDTHGHPAGDTVLAEVARAIVGQLRAEDSLCRYGGEEFCIVLRSVDLQGAHATGERIRRVIESLTIEHPATEHGATEHGAIQLRVTASVGCSARSELDDPTPTGLIALADKRLYMAKRSGRNRVVSQGE